MIVDELTDECSLRHTATELAIAAKQYTKAAILPSFYQDFARLFNEEASHRFLPQRHWDHAIEFKPDTPSASDCKIYPMTQVEDAALRDFLKEQLAKGYIRVSKSPYASPFFFIKKKDGKLRPVQDYHRINDFTIQNQYPLPLISDLILDLSNAHTYTKLDVRWGYNNVCIREGDEGKATFKTRYGLFEPTVMFFGLTNSPAMFQTMMNAIFSEVILFHSPRMDYLGVILEKGVTMMDPVKLDGLCSWPIPKTKKGVRSLLGFGNFYRPFIPRFAHITQPLTLLTHKGVDFIWGPEQQRAFDHLIKAFTSAPVLVHPVLTDPFILEVDASGYAVGAVLLQRKEDKKLHPVGHFSKTLNAAERNYDIYDLELLAIVYAVCCWRILLAGSPHKIKIFSDHLNLQYWRSPQKISRRIAREVLELSEYDFEIHHIKGTSNGRADALSRWESYDRGDHNNEGVVVLPDAVFVRAMEVVKGRSGLTEITPDEMEPSNPVYAQDEHILRPWVDAHRLKHINGMWYKDGRQVVTGGLHDKSTIIRAHHDSPVFGHPGIKRTMVLTGRAYWWPSMKTDVQDYVKGCAECQRHKVNTRPIRAPLYPITPRPNALPFETIALDFITKLPS